MGNEIRKLDPDEQAHEVVSLLLQGQKPANIASALGLPRRVVEQHIMNFKEVAHKMPELKDRAKEALAGMDFHYDMLIKQAYEELESIDLTANKTPAMYGQRISLLRLIANLEETRMKALQQAGLIDDMGDEVAELMEKNDILEGIIRDVSAKCPNCKIEVARRLGQYTGQVEVVNA